MHLAMNTHERGRKKKKKKEYEKNIYYRSWSTLRSSAHQHFTYTLQAHGMATTNTGVSATRLVLNRTAGATESPPPAPPPPALPRRHKYNTLLKAINLR